MTGRNCRAERGTRKSEEKRIVALNGKMEQTNLEKWWQQGEENCGEEKQEAPTLEDNNIIIFRGSLPLHPPWYLCFTENLQQLHSPCQTLPSP